MPNPHDPGAIWDPGLNAGYRRGRTAMDTVKVHCTAGYNSYGICKNNGLIQWLIPYEGKRWQMAEADAWCFDSGPYNGWGPGFEIERPVTGGLIRPGLSEFRDLSQSQVDQLHELVWWLRDEWGFSLKLYDGPRYGCPSTYGGFVNHGDIEPQRSDGVARGEWVMIVGGESPEPVPEPRPTRRKGLRMFMAYLLDTQWVDVWYATALIDSFPNEGPHNSFGIGPKMQRYLDGGAVLQTYGGPGGPTVDDYTRVDPPGIREQLQPTLR